MPCVDVEMVSNIAEADGLVRRASILPALGVLRLRTTPRFWKPIILGGLCLGVEPPPSAATTALPEVTATVPYGYGDV